MIEDLTRAEYEAVLRQDFTTFAARCFHELNPQAELAMGWHIEVIAAALTAVQQGKIRRLIINLPPGHLKSLMASVAFPAWYLCHDPSAQLLCYAGGCYECGIALKQSRARSAGRARPATGGSARVALPRLFNLGFFDDRATAFVVERPSLRDRKFVDLYGAFPVKRVVLGCADGFLFGAGKAVFRPVACDQVRGVRGRGQGTETLAKAWRLAA